MLILDEPTAGLDPVGVASILGNIHDYHTAKNATIIIVSHSMEEVARTVDRLVVINDGRIPFSGAPREVFAHGDELEAMGLGVPAMTRVFHRLRAMGVDIDPSVYTTEQARDAVLAKLGHAGPAEAVCFRRKGGGVSGIEGHYPGPVLPRQHPASPNWTPYQAALLHGLCHWLCFWPSMWWAMRFSSSCWRC